ncbi:PREDICTED: SWI/SNF complex subunit SWI3A [Tarenaya hassleriana]|uniref:SWI/SNF complex subunit SWI3A n=1 Tax=Tarenaya hassleriana TaxID=28532 RepID=UPI00053C7A7D|nr:PREDICTED: SWI/SNF complex subunit SWI3A [Tarenaya hassleriana]
MEATDPIWKEPELELYTVPAQSSWFSWDDIHEIERRAFEEFFSGSSITRTPKIYKEYRDFIINKYREDPSRKLTFTAVRKYLVGDVNLLQKVFLFLKKWGLINFDASKSSDDTLVEIEEKQKVKIEEGTPAGVRVTATPTSLRPITSPPYTVDVNEQRPDTGSKLPPLTSYSVVFNDLRKPYVLVCGSCGERSDSAHYEHVKSSISICEKCFKSGKYGENNSEDDFKLMDSVGDKNPAGAVWTEEETLLLLESMLKHGDDWELVAQSVPTKSKLDCISKLIELPFGNVLMGSASGRDNSSISPRSINDPKGRQFSPSRPSEQMKSEGQDHEQTNEREEKGDTVDEEEPPAKRKRVASPLDATGNSLMKQVTTMGTSVGPAATKAAIAALCDEASCPREMLTDSGDCEDLTVKSHQSLIPERADGDKDTEKEEQRTDYEEPQEASSMEDLPLALRIRTSAAAALGAAAAHAKILADQEEREMELLAATVIDEQLKKLQSKMKFLDHLELLMDMEEREIEAQKERLLDDRMGVLQSAFRAGLTKRWDHTYLK